MALNICERQVKISSHSIRGSSSFGSRCLQALVGRIGVSRKSQSAKKNEPTNCPIYLLEEIFQVWQSLPTGVLVRLDHDLARLSNFYQPVEMVEQLSMSAAAR